MWRSGTPKRSKSWLSGTLKCSKNSCWGHPNGIKFQSEKILNPIFWDFLKSEYFFLHFSTNPNTNWTYGQNIEHCDTPPLNNLFDLFDKFEDINLQVKKTIWIMIFLVLLKKNLRGCLWKWQRRFGTICHYTFSNKVATFSSVFDPFKCILQKKTWDHILYLLFKSRYKICPLIFIILPRNASTDSLKMLQLTL